MKTLVISDVHGETFWQKIVNRENPDLTIFLGDYLDSFNISPFQQFDNLNNILSFKESEEKAGRKVILLLGNHDVHYVYNDSQLRCTGYKSKTSLLCNRLLFDNKSKFQICYQLDNILFSHAGISSKWLQLMDYDNSPISDFLNDFWTFKPSVYSFNNIENTTCPYGNDLHQNPIWIRPEGLMKGNENSFLKGFYQVVGHTKYESIKSISNYYFTDTIDLKEYLIINDGEFSINIIN